MSKGSKIRPAANDDHRRKEHDRIFKKNKSKKCKVSCSRCCHVYTIEETQASSNCPNCNKLYEYILPDSNKRNSGR